MLNSIKKLKHYEIISIENISLLHLTKEWLDNGIPKTPFCLIEPLKRPKQRPKARMSV
jgi:hypothetical protein